MTSQLYAMIVNASAVKKRYRECDSNLTSKLPELVLIFFIISSQQSFPPDSMRSLTSSLVPTWPHHHLSIKLNVFDWYVPKYDVTTNKIMTSQEDGSAKPAMSATVDVDLWKIFSERSTKCIVKIVDFAKQLPGFSRCSINDKITLIKKASMDVLVC